MSFKVEKLCSAADDEVGNTCAVLTSAVRLGKDSTRLFTFDLVGLNIDSIQAQNCNEELDLAHCKFLSIKLFISIMSSGMFSYFKCVVETDNLFF